MNLDKTKRLIMKPDKYQLDAIKSTKNTLLIAGAGAGKTFTIVEKIKYLVNEIGIKQEEILVISFTNKSVNDLKKKIDFDINIMTFHKLAMSVLDKKNINYNLVSDTELEFITNEYFRSIDLEKRDEILRYFKEYDYDKFLNSYKYIQFKKIIITLIKLYKTNNKNKDDIKKLFLKDYFLSKYTYIIKCLYDNELNSSNRLDFDDLIIKATQCLDEDLGYKYIIIDEFQDTSLIRFNLIKKIKELSGSTFFCVGDDYQSIYHFSGCDINIFLNFTKYIPNSEIKKLYDSEVPIFAICLGHQLMALATGGDTHKMKYGHRGGNHPVKDLATGRVYISSQNHGYVVDAEGLEEKNIAKPAFVNVNDGTNEGMAYEGKNIFTVQFHPEACPGPQDSSYLFDRFMDMMGGNK